MLDDDIIRRTIGHVLSARFGPAFDHADVRFGDDQLGDRAVFIKAHFRPDALLPDGPYANRAATELRLKLLDMGEERFPYLDLHYPDVLEAPLPEQG